MVKKRKSNLTSILCLQRALHTWLALYNQIIDTDREDPDLLDVLSPKGKRIQRGSTATAAVISTPPQRLQLPKPGCKVYFCRPHELCKPWIKWKEHCASCGSSAEPRHIDPHPVQDRLGHSLRIDTQTRFALCTEEIVVSEKPLSTLCDVK